HALSLLASVGQADSCSSAPVAPRAAHLQDEQLEGDSLDMLRLALAEGDLPLLTASLDAWATSESSAGAARAPPRPWPTGLQRSAPACGPPSAATSCGSSGPLAPRPGKTSAPCCMALGGLTPCWAPRACSATTTWGPCGPRRCRCSGSGAPSAAPRRPAPPRPRGRREAWPRPSRCAG
ncbi:unnamed protein product, partial [Prorocentrum cordatum]